MQSRTIFRFAYAIFITLVVIGTLEFGSRFLMERKGILDSENYKKVSADFPDFDSHMRSWTECGISVWKYREKIYEDYYIYGPNNCESETINFGGEFLSRATPASKPLEESDTVVWAFGGSTMVNIDTTDEYTIANTIASRFNEAGRKAHVKNFGVGSFQSSLEMVKFVTILSRTAEKAIPDVVIFYDGINDSLWGFWHGAGNIQSDLSQKLAALVEDRNFTLFTYSFSKLLAGHSAFWNSYIHPSIHDALFNSDPQPDEENLERAVRIYVRNMQTSNAVCESIGARCFFVLQPSVLTKKELGDIEKGIAAEFVEKKKGAFARFMRGFNDRVRSEMQQKRNFIDLTGMFDGDKRDIFYDGFHAAPLAGPIIGDAIATEVLNRMVAIDEQSKVIRNSP